MFNQLSTSTRRRSRFCRGYSLLEMMVTMVGTSAIVGSILVTGTTVVNTMEAVTNYNDLSKRSRNTLNFMSRDFRDTAIVTSLSTSQVTTTNVITGDTISYSWDGADTCTRTFNGVRTVMLTGCDNLIFSGYQRNPTSNLEFVPATTAAQTKLISVSWRCSRQIFGAKLNTESVQAARICIRN